MDPGPSACWAGTSSGAVSQDSCCSLASLLRGCVGPSDGHQEALGDRRERRGTTNLCFTGRVLSDTEDIRHLWPRLGDLQVPVTYRGPTEGDMGFY